MNRFIIAISFFFLTSPALADDLNSFLESFNPQKQKYKLKYELDDFENKNLLEKYCKGDVNSYKALEPRYSNSLVRKAAKVIRSTDAKAKAVLQGRALKQMVEDVRSAKKLATKLKESKNMVVKQQATSLEVSLHSNSEFTNPMYVQSLKISKVLTQEIKSLVDDLVLKLEEDLLPIDNEKFKKAIDGLNIELPQDLEKVSFARLKSSTETLLTKYQEQLDFASSETVQQLAEGIVKEAELASAQEPEVIDFKHMRENAEALVEEVKANGINGEDIHYSINGLLYYYDDEDLNHSIQSRALSKKLGRQYLSLKSKDLLGRIKNLEVALDGSSEDNGADIIKVNREARQLSYGVNEVNPWSSVDLQAAHEIFLQEFSKFRTMSIVSQAQKIKLLAGQEDWGVAHREANNLSYNLDQIKSSLKEGSVKFWTQLKSELAKLQSENIKKESKELQASLSPLDDITEEFTWTVESFGNYFKNAQLELPTARAAADNYIAFAKEIGFAIRLKILTKTRIEDAKPGMHYYFYGHVWKHYRQVEKPSFVTSNAHKFITQLCGEYRDRATMIEAKLKWVANGLFILPTKDDGVDSTITAMTKNVWSKVQSEWYYPYLDVTSSLWRARREAQPRYIKMGTYEVEGEGKKVDNPVKGTTVCETKFIFAEYVSKDKVFATLEEFNTSYDEFKVDCPIADTQDYYDFRGDSNFKHYSPESNGMIWYANNLGRACRSRDRIKSSTQNYTDSDCEEYFKNPFNKRYSGARSILASWLFRATEFDQVFGSSSENLALYSHRSPELAPYSFGFDQNTIEHHFQFSPDWQGIPFAERWLKSDMGYNEYTGLSDDSPSPEAQDKAFILISNAVDRHTDWYASGYNDGNGFVRDQATSPFVASSYVMSSSDAFTTCGTTIQCPNDGLKRWMFVFRIKGENWYGPHRIAKGEQIDFDRHWFDETSFGFTGLADAEHAWDRLGTALEEELDSILYLVNVGGDDFGGGIFHSEGDGEIFLEPAE